MPPGYNPFLRAPSGHTAGKRRRRRVRHHLSRDGLHDLATDLGAKSDAVGNLVVDARQRTVIPGLYAAGDVVDEINQIAVAFGHAAVAATDMHNYLSEADDNRLAG